MELLWLQGIFFRAVGTLPIFSSVQDLEAVRYPSFLMQVLNYATFGYLATVLSVRFLWFNFCVELQ